MCIGGVAHHRRARDPSDVAQLRAARSLLHGAQHESITTSLALVALTAFAGCATDDSASTDPTDPTDPADTSDVLDPPPPPSLMSEAALSSNEHTAFNFFVSKGLTKIQSAGVVGNLMQESSVQPTAVQYGGGPGRGIAQWSVGGRWNASSHDNVTWYASAHGLSRWSLTAQLDFIWYELTTFGYGLSSLRAATTVTAATIAFQDKYEICGTCNSTARIHDAQQVLASFGGGGGGGGASCYSHTLGREMPDNACVQSRSDSLWYQCANGSWVDRWTDPAACNGVHPL